MQAIARANRVKEGKNNGLIVDYCGILKNLRKALATFAGHTGDGPLDGQDAPETDPLHPEEELLGELAEAIALVRDQLTGNGFDLSVLRDATGFSRNQAILNAKEAVNLNDESRKRFEIAARAVFRKYKACLTFKGVQAFRDDSNAISFLYKTLQEDKEQADTSAIIQKLNAIVSEAIEVTPDPSASDRLFDISKINFEALRTEFAKSETKRSDVQDMKSVLEQRLRKMLAENPTRVDFQTRYDEIVRGYNQEKDKNTIEATFEALMMLTAEMTEEEQRHTAEGLENEEQLAVFDILRKPELTQSEIKQVKKVAVGILQEIERQMRETQDIFSKQTTRDRLRQRLGQHREPAPLVGPRRSLRHPEGAGAHQAAAAFAAACHQQP